MARPRSGQILLGPQGRLVVPSNLRQQLGISPGDVLVARVDRGRLVLESRDAITVRLRSRFASLPADVSVAGELIAERREESQAEELETRTN